MKKLLFVSDIVGTISKATPINYQELAQLLNLLKEKHGADEVIFSLCTSDSDVKLLESNYCDAYSVLKEYGISFGKQFYSLGYTENGELYDKAITDNYGSINKIETLISYARDYRKIVK